jgi:hypothetical protein
MPAFVPRPSSLGSDDVPTLSVVCEGGDAPASDFEHTRQKSAEDLNAFSMCWLSNPGGGGGFSLDSAAALN